MALSGGLSSMFRVHRGPRRWVFLPHAVLCAFCLLVGLFMVDDLRLLLVYMVLLPGFVIQIALPTRAGWIVAFSGWLAFCSLIIFDECRELRFGAIPGINIWLLLAIVVQSSAPLYLLRPGGKPVGHKKPVEDAPG